MYQAPDDPQYVLMDKKGMIFRVHSKSLNGVNPNNDGIYKFSCDIPFSPESAGAVIGRGNYHVKNWQEKFKVSITIPENQFLFKVYSNNQESLEIAKSAILDHINSKSSKQRYSHFIGIPCIDGVFQNGVKEYLKDLSSKTKVIHSAYSNIKKMHLTLILMTLKNQEEIGIARRIIDEIVSTYNWKCDNQLEFSGINTFTKRNETSIFYAQPRGNDILSSIVEIQGLLAAELSKAGISNISVNDKLHITILRPEFISKDYWGTESMIGHAFNYQLPAATIDSVALCVMGSAKEGFYDIVFSKQLYQASPGVIDE